MKFLLFLVFSIVLVCNECAALRWGRTGHSTIARLAASLLNSNATAFVSYLLPDTDLPSIANWADEVRDELPWSAALHYINTPDWQCSYNRATNCPTTNDIKMCCVDGAIQNYTYQLSVYETLSYNQSVEALKFLVHFVGDVHQPLHVSFASDEGGNKEKGMICDATSKSSLHSIWDQWIIEERVSDDFSGSDDNYYNFLLNQLQTSSTANISAWSSCASDPAPYNACSDIWANESAKYACTNAYVDTDGSKITNGFNLGCDYYQKNYPLIEMRLIQGAVRLANVLNALAQNYNPSK